VTESGSSPKYDRALHVLNRCAFGPRPGDLERVRAMGAEAYIHQQLNPESIAIPNDLVERVAGYRTLHMSPIALFVEYQRPVMEARRSVKASKRETAGAGAGGDNGALKDVAKDARIRARVVMREAVEARIVRAIHGPRQLQEVMTAFWFNHFNVFAGKGLDNIWTGAFEENAIRPHTMGRFRTLLGATAHHPAMLFYLDNWQNTAPGSPGSKGKFEGINENYARELMELHTLGVGGGYTQADVIALAHILTGWGLPRPRGGAARKPGGGIGGFAAFARRGNFVQANRPKVDPGGFFFDADRHDFSTKTFLGHSFEGSGISEGEHALDILARSPATATHLSFKLAQYFVADDPPKPLVAAMAKRWQATDGDIRAVLETMFTSAEYWDRKYYAAKFKTPYEFVVSSVRATGAPVRNFRPLYGTMALLGMPLYGCQTPNGYSNTQDAWLNPDAMMTRLSFAAALGQGYLPLENPPFEEDANGDGARREPAVVPRKGGGRIDVKLDVEPAKPRQPKMTPPDSAQMGAALGENFSSTTANALEAAPPRLRASLMLGSPEFMVR
jgi:uncharacterized protein (DUF1800 family)